MLTKFIGIYPITKLFGAPKREGVYTTLLMSTGLTFGTISALFGLSHGIISGNQYSYLVAVVIASAFVPTIIANLFFFPHHHLPPAEVMVEDTTIKKHRSASSHYQLCPSPNQRLRGTQYETHSLCLRWLGTSRKSL